jgi:hypothetical protein
MRSETGTMEMVGKQRAFSREEAVGQMATSNTKVRYS